MVTVTAGVKVPSASRAAPPIRAGMTSHLALFLDVYKRQALQYFLRYFDAKPSELIAFGDGMNDKEMLELAGYSYAMENAEPALKKIAKYEAPSNNTCLLYTSRCV